MKGTAKSELSRGRWGWYDVQPEVAEGQLRLDLHHRHPPLQAEARSCCR